MLKRLQAEDTGKGVIFENENFEKFTKTGVINAILVYWFYWIVLLLLNYYLGSAGIWLSIGIYFSALFFWTFFEYMAHRFLFHFVNEKRLIQKFHRAIHGIHHEYPRDVKRLIMPPLPGTIILLLLIGFFYIFLGTYTFIFVAGFLNGWAFYVSIHFIIHAYQPIEKFKILWSHHAKHHYKSGDKAFGVSSPLWDYIFGTMP